MRIGLARLMAVGCCLVGAARSLAVPAQIVLAGGDEVAWMIVHGPESAEANAAHVVALWCARPTLEGRPVAQVLWKEMPTMNGNLRMHAASRDSLYLCFVNGDLAVVSANGLCTPLERPSRQLVICGIAADSAGDDLFALTRSGDGDAREWSLQRFGGGGWSRVAILSQAPNDRDAIWMTARRGRVVIVWGMRHPTDGVAPGSAPSLQPLQAIDWNENEWSAVLDVPTMNPHGDIWLGWDGDTPMGLVAQWLSGDGADAASKASPAPRQFAELLRLSGGAWRSEGVLNEAPKPNAQVARLSFAWNEFEAAITAQRLMLVRGDGAGRNAIGWATLTANPTVNWDSTGMIGSPLARPRLPAWTHMAAVAGMILFLLFLRPDREAMFAELPAHLRTAMPVHRMLAFVIDLIPCMLLTLFWWIEPLGVALRQAPQWERLSPEELQRASDALFGGPWLIVICTYALYGIVWELFTGTTPGKHLLGCRVVNARAERPSSRQVFIRGFLRVPELLSIWITATTFFVMLVLSPRRQRIGDVLAGTIVVQVVTPVATAVPVAAPHTPDASDSGGPPTDTPGGAPS